MLHSSKLCNRKEVVEIKQSDSKEIKTETTRQAPLGGQTFKKYK